MARANGNHRQDRDDRRVFEIEFENQYKTTLAVCWSAAVISVFPNARPISWVEHADHVLVNGEIKVKELRHISRSCV